ncbi:MAG: glutamate 5-kinase [Bacteroidales bacterium]|nr:glutamate 5-kinase [Bacteroidales bacterium]
MKITVIGAGNMGGSTALGLAACGAVSAPDITVTARHPESLGKFSGTGICTSTDNRSAVKGSDIVFYAVKPWQMEGVLKETLDCLDFDRQLIVSIAPGVTPHQLRSWLAKDGRVPSIAYVIPNTAIEIGESMTYISPVTASEEQTALLKGLFDKAGKSVVVPPEQMLAGTSLASCGIAYAMRYISASERGGAELGLAPEGVGEAVCQTVRGAAALVAAKGGGPEAEIKRVTTPGGLTLRGLKAMEDGGFSNSVVKGLTVIKTPRRGRIVIKVGSNVLTRSDGSLDTTRVSSIVDQIAALRKDGYEPVLVTSGAVACGRSLIREDASLSDVQQRQLYSSVGQVKLMDLYYRLFQNYGISVGQVLTQKKNFDAGQEYDNQKSCMEVMLGSGVLPIVNENDTVSITELMFTDNDELSGLVAGMVGAGTLIILTNVDGIFNGDPDSPGSEVIRRIAPGEDVAGFISSTKSSRGRGGMKSKCGVAMSLASCGIRVIIANGRRDGILTCVLSDPEATLHTEFTPAVSNSK